MIKLNLQKLSFTQQAVLSSYHPSNPFVHQAGTQPSYGWRTELAYSMQYSKTHLTALNNVSDSLPIQILGLHFPFAQLHNDGSQSTRHQLEYPDAPLQLY